MRVTGTTTRRQLLGALGSAAALAVFPAQAQQAPAVAFPYYSGEQALQGLYQHHLPPLAKAFEVDAQTLVAEARRFCAASGGNRAALQARWRRALLAWQALSSPALGPVIERRSQRLIDFWPMRPALLKKAMARQPQTLADMATVGTPAKGFPAMDWLLSQPADPAACPYLTLIAEGIAAEATALRTGVDALAARDWTSDEDAARKAFAEWINQWLGGLERLRWAHMEQPVQRARTAGQQQAPAFARQALADNLSEWRTQWQALRVQARLSPEQAKHPPQPGQGLIPIEALLMGKGHIALAQRWGQTIDAVDGAWRQLPDRPTDDDLLALSKTLKRVTALYQAEVAAALDVPLGFSDADGD